MVPPDFDFVAYGQIVHEYLLGELMAAASDHPLVGSYTFTRFRGVFFLPIYFFLLGGISLWWLWLNGRYAIRRGKMFCGALDANGDPV